MVQSHDGSIRSVVEKGDALLASVHYPSIRDKMNKLQRDYTELCRRAKVRNWAEVTCRNLKLSFIHRCSADM